MTGLLVAGGQVLLPDGWAISDVLIRDGRIVTAHPNVGYGGETVDGAGGTIEGRRTGGAGAERATLAVAVEDDTVSAARGVPLAAGGHTSLPVLDARGLRVIPGLIDLQCNGGYGIDLATEPERLWELAALLPRTGVTAWLPTIVTAPPDVRARALATLRSGPPRAEGSVRPGLPSLPSEEAALRSGPLRAEGSVRPGGASSSGGGSVRPGLPGEGAAPGSGPPRAGEALRFGLQGEEAARRSGPPPDDGGSRVFARPLGLHLEGPLLNPERRGAHPGGLLRRPGDDDVGADGWSREAGVALVTLAPELPGALDVVRRLVDRDVVVSAGHTSATVVEAAAAVEAGVRWVTHLFNAMAPFHHREPGLVGVALGDERLRAGVIADGIHLHPVTVAAAARALGDRLTLVTDAVAALGRPAGPVRLGRLEATVDRSGVRLGDGTLAGSDLSLDQAVRNLGDFAGVDVAAAVRAASAVPAAVLALDDHGVVTPGAVGDLVVLDEAGTVVATVIGGVVAHDRRRESRAGPPGTG